MGERKRETVRERERERERERYRERERKRNLLGGKERKYIKIFQYNRTKTIFHHKLNCLTKRRSLQSWKGEGGGRGGGNVGIVFVSLYNIL